MTPPWVAAAASAAGQRGAPRRDRREDERTAVRVVRWPEDADRRDRLAEAGIPRIVITTPGISLVADDPLEAWIPATVTAIDLATTAKALEETAKRVAERSTPPTLDESGLLRWAGRTV